MDDVGKCVGRPIGFTGGEVKFCDEPLPPGSGRFCYRCHLAAIFDAKQRIRSLRLSLENAEMVLATLVEEASSVER